MAVSFCVVANSAQDQDDLLAVAKLVAVSDTFGRKVVKLGDPELPSPLQLRQFAATANLVDPRAIVLRGDGTVFDVLTVEKAKNGLIVEDRFARAAVEGA